MRNVIDTASWQKGLDFRLPFADGFRDVYVKMGGDNVDTYEAPYYEAQVDAAVAAGFEHVGHYWVPDGNPDDSDDVDTPTEQADFMLERLHKWDPITGFIVLDNENLDGAIRFTDAQAAEFVERVKAVLKIPGKRVKWYTNLADARAHEWPLLLATGVDVIIAAPSYPAGTFTFPNLPTIPAERIVGHQHGTRTWGGVVTDVNTFTDDAFDYEGGDIVALVSPFPKANWSSPFGEWPQWRKDMGLGPHRGLDFNGLAAGTKIPASGSGRVTARGWSSALGWWVMVFYPSASVYFGYCHLHEQGPAVGTTFELGNTVGLLGNTGSATTGAHLHLTASRSNGNPGLVAVIDPAQFLTIAAAPAGGSTTPIDNKQEEQDMGLPHYHWAPNRGGVLITDHLGPIVAPNAEYAQAWKEQFPAPGGTDITTRKWDVLVQSARDRKALYEAITAAASPSVDVSADDIAKALAPQVIAGVVGEIGESNGATAAEVEEITNRVVRRVFGDAAAE